MGEVVERTTDPASKLPEMVVEKTGDVETASAEWAMQRRSRSIARGRCD